MSLTEYISNMMVDTMCKKLMCFGIGTTIAYIGCEHLGVYKLFEKLSEKLGPVFDNIFNPILKYTKISIKKFNIILSFLTGILIFLVAYKLYEFIKNSDNCYSIISKTILSGILMLLCIDSVKSYMNFE